jgi:hypothetical protein
MQERMWRRNRRGDRQSAQDAPAPSTAVRLAGTVAIILAPIMMLALGELVLRATGKYRTYSERKGFEYASPYQGETNWFLRKALNSVTEVNESEFRHSMNANSLGFRDAEWPLEKAPNEFRVLVLGDSFIEGYGAEADQTMPAELGKLLSQAMPGRQVRVMNGGISGSDPVHNLHALTRVFLSYKPDVVIQAVNSLDLFDIMTRGGIDRYDANGHRPANHPAIERWFRVSHLVRAILIRVFRYNHFLMSRATTAEKMKVARQVLCDVIKLQGDLSGRNDFRLIVIVQPMPGERGKSPTPMAGLESCIAPNVEYADLFLELPLAALDRNLFWKLDGHFTPTGYRLYAQLAAKKILAVH